MTVVISSPIQKKYAKSARFGTVKKKTRPYLDRCNAYANPKTSQEFEVFLTYHLADSSWVSGLNYFTDIGDD